MSLTGLIRKICFVAAFRLASRLGRIRLPTLKKAVLISIVSRSCSSSASAGTCCLFTSLALCTMIRILAFDYIIIQLR